MSHQTKAYAPSTDGNPSPAIVIRDDGVFFDASATAAACKLAASQVFQANAFFVGLDYAVFIKLLYHCGPDLPPALRDQPLVRFADRIAPFHAVRRELYKAVKIVDGEAEYYFEPVYFFLPDLPPQPAKLNFDEFVADMWTKGIRFGIDAPAVRAAIAGGRANRIVAARRLEATPGRDADIVEVSSDIQRSDAPRLMAGGRVDMNYFQNRFPQVKPNVRLLRKIARAAGSNGYEMSGIVIEPAVPRDIELSSVAGSGTVIEHLADGEYLVSALEGFISVDPDSKRLSIGAKIVSREGVSTRTTGNLQLTGEYEEFGEVQEGRVVDGGNVTIHGDVFGIINSRGGDIMLQRNLVGGSASNADGDISLRGVASGAVLQTRRGTVTLARAESCIISGTRVVIEEASNCEILADEVEIKLAEGCAIAARQINIGAAGPRKQTEMLVYPLVPDTSKYDQKIAELDIQVRQAEQLAQQYKNEIDALTSQPEVRSYLNLATRVRKHELVLTAEQEPLFHKMAAAAGPTLKTVSKVSLAMKAAQLRQAQAQEQVDLVKRKKQALLGATRCSIASIGGEVLVRTMSYNPDKGSVHELTPKEIKAKVRHATAGLRAIFAGHHGSFEWTV